MVMPQFRAIAQLAREGFTNIGVLPPMATHADQYRRWLEIAESAGVSGVAYGLMVETPRAAYAIGEFLDMRFLPHT